MNPSKPDKGLIVSGVVHAALLAVALVGFSETPKFEEAQETVPVEMITDQQFNQIMKGEKDAKQVKPTPQKVDKPAPVEDKRPTPQTEAKTDVPTPPPPLKRIPDPGEDDEPTPPTPPTPPRRVAALPPPEPAKPEPAKPEPAKPEPPLPPTRPDPPKAETKPEPPPKPDAEAIKPPTPPVRPPEPKKAEVTPPAPPRRPTPPKVEPKTEPKSEDKPSLDKMALAKLLDQKKADDTAKPVSRPRSGDDSNEPRTRFDSNSVSKLLSREPPGQRPATGATASQTASLGSPTANAAKMSPSMWGALDGLLQDQYKQCWSYLALNTGQRYIPQIKVEYTREGALAAQPALLNPPGDPNLRALSESALRAVRRCNPLRIPPQFAPYYDQWKSRILRFDPEEMAG